MALIVILDPLTKSATLANTTDMSDRNSLVCRRELLGLADTAANEETVVVVSP